MEDTGRLGFAGRAGGLRPEPAAQSQPKALIPGASKLRVLVACEYSATVRDAFRARGFDAWSCDLLPTEGDPRWHYQGDVRFVLSGKICYHWDLLIAHPPCTYLSRAGARWWGTPERDALADEAAEFVFKLRDAPVPHIAIENPIGQLNKRWRYPDQTIQPYEFGHPFSKATCLWLKNLPPLMPTEIVADYKPLIRSNTGVGKRAGQKSHGGLSGGLVTAKTFPGIAGAMADQWGDYLLNRRIAAPFIADEGHDTPFCEAFHNVDRQFPDGAGFTAPDPFIHSDGVGQ